MDRSIWEVRSQKQVYPTPPSLKVDLTEPCGQNFTYSKIQLWVALDRALRLADKRCLPCPKRMEWLRCRDTIYEEIMERGFNEEKQVCTPFNRSHERHLSNRLRAGMCLIRQF
jgi:GH15 family glucan-1,4-alpha-glucosidase